MSRRPLRTRNSDNLLVGFGIGFAVLWVIGILLSLTMAGLVIWGLIELVQFLATLS